MSSYLILRRFYEVVTELLLVAMNYCEVSGVLPLRPSFGLVELLIILSLAIAPPR